MENESLREPKSSVVMFLSIALIVALCWALAFTVKAVNRGKDVERITKELGDVRAESEQIKQEAQITKADADRVRATAMEWTRQHQLQLQAEMSKKAEEAAKAAKAKEEAAKKPVIKKSSTPGKGKAITPAKKGAKTTAKKVVHKTHS
jgi:biopolymer transport protein ExbB/TolQ